MNSNRHVVLLPADEDANAHLLRIFTRDPDLDGTVYPAPVEGVDYGIAPLTDAALTTEVEAILAQHAFARGAVAGQVPPGTPERPEYAIFDPETWDVEFQPSGRLRKARVLEVLKPESLPPLSSVTVLEL